MAVQQISGILTGEYQFSASITVNDPTSGFSLAIGDSTTDAFSFSGFSGYIFDWSGDFVGGYQSGNPFLISGNIFNESPQRMSYFIDDVLIKNNMNPVEMDSDTISFDPFNSGSMILNITEVSNSEIYTFLTSSEGYTLESSDSYIFVV